MEKYLEQWLRDHKYELYAEAKGYRVYENDKLTVVINPKGAVILIKPLTS